MVIAPLLLSQAAVVVPSPVEEQADAANVAKSANSRFRHISDSLLRHNPDSAFAYSLVQVLTSVNHADTLAEANGRYQLGKCYFEIGQYELASDSYTQAIELFRSVNDSNGEALVLRSLGYLLYNMGNTEGALEYYLNSIKLLEKIESASDKSELFNRLGVVYAKLNMPLESKGYFDKALVLDEYRNDSTAISRTLNNLGFAFILLNRPKEALNYLQESLSIKQKANLGDASICPTFHNIAESFFLMGQPDSAIVYSRRGLEIAERLGLLQRKKESGELQAKIYSSIGNFKQAFIAQEMFYKTSGDILDQNNALLINTMIEQHKYEMVEKENLIGKMTTRRTGVFSFTGVGLVVSALLLLLALLVKQKLPGLVNVTRLLTMVLAIVWLAQSAIGILVEYGFTSDWLSFACLVLSSLLVSGLQLMVRPGLKM